MLFFGEVAILTLFKIFSLYTVVVLDRLFVIIRNYLFMLFVKLLNFVC